MNTFGTRPESVLKPRAVLCVQNLRDMSVNPAVQSVAGAFPRRFFCRAGPLPSRGFGKQNLPTGGAHTGPAAKVSIQIDAFGRIDACVRLRETSRILPLRVPNGRHCFRLSRSWATGATPPTARALRSQKRPTGAVAPTKQSQPRRNASDPPICRMRPKRSKPHRLRSSACDQNGHNRIASTPIRRSIACDIRSSTPSGCSKTLWRTTTSVDTLISPALAAAAAHSPCGSDDVSTLGAHAAVYAGIFVL